MQWYYLKDDKMLTRWLTSGHLKKKSIFEQPPTHSFWLQLCKYCFISAFDVHTTPPCANDTCAIWAKIHLIKCHCYWEKYVERRKKIYLRKQKKCTSSFGGNPVGKNSITATSCQSKYYLHHPNNCTNYMYTSSKIPNI